MMKSLELTRIQVDLDELYKQLQQLRGDSKTVPDASIVIPVNAQGDFENVLQLLADIARYKGSHSFEVVLVINNYEPDEPPPEIDMFRNLGLCVVSYPSVRRPGEAVSFTARIPGLRAASSEKVISFDADCRLPNPSPLLDWYFHQLEAGAKAAYTHVRFYDLRKRLQIRVRLLIHYSGRWVKRNILKIPTTRGGNYAVNRSFMLALYDQGFLADDMNVGPAFKAAGGRVVYSGSKTLVAFTSGRMISGYSWLRLFKYYVFYRIPYNLRVLRVRPDVASHTGRQKDPVRRYINNRPIR